MDVLAVFFAEKRHRRRRRRLDNVLSQTESCHPAASPRHSAEIETDSTSTSDWIKTQQQNTRVDYCWSTISCIFKLVIVYLWRAHQSWPSVTSPHRQLATVSTERYKRKTNL